MYLECRRATIGDHANILVFARQSPYTKDFGNQIMFSGPAHYAKGWIRVAVDSDTNHIVGFTCRREKIRTPRTKLYFLATDMSCYRLGVAKALVNDLQGALPLDRGDIELSCAKSNAAARALYLKLGFVVEDEDDEYHFMFRRDVR